MNGQGPCERYAVRRDRRERIYPFREPGASSECMNAFPTRGGGRFGYMDTILLKLGKTEKPLV